MASVRTGDKIKQKIVRHVGIAMDDDELVRLKALAKLVKAKLEAEHQASLFTPETVANQVIEAKAKRAAASIKTVHVDLTQLQEHRVFAALLGRQ